MCKQQYLQLLLIESLQQVLGDDLIEALLQSQELGLYASQKTPVDVEPDVLFLGVLSNRDALTVGLQLVLDDLSVGIVFDAEGVVQHTCDVVVTEEREASELAFEGLCTLTQELFMPIRLVSPRFLECVLISETNRCDIKMIHTWSENMCLGATDVGNTQKPWGALSSMYST